MLGSKEVLWLDSEEYRPLNPLAWIPEYAASRQELAERFASGIHPRFFLVGAPECLDPGYLEGILSDRPFMLSILVVDSDPAAGEVLAGFGWDGWIRRDQIGDFSESGAGFTLVRGVSSLGPGHREILGHKMKPISKDDLADGIPSRFNLFKKVEPQRFTQILAAGQTLPDAFVEECWLMEEEVARFAAEVRKFRDSLAPMNEGVFLASDAQIGSWHYLEGEMVPWAKAPVDIFGQFPSGKTLLLAREGAVVSPSKVASLKGKCRWAIRLDDQGKYVAALGQGVKEVSALLNFGEEALKYLVMSGVDPQSLRQAENFCIQQQRAVIQLAQGPNSFLLENVKYLLSKPHSLRVSVIAALMLEPLGIRQAKIVESVGLACLLHDIGLMGMPERVQEGSGGDLYPEELALLHGHPERGAKILEKVEGLDPLVTTAVAQHHERRTGKGYPAGLGAGEIQRISEIVGIADEFSQALDRVMKDPGFDLATYLKKEVFNGFSSGVVDAFCKGVLPGKRIY